MKLLKTNFRYGVIMGLGFCVYTTFMWLTKLDSTYLHIGQYFDMAIILLPIAVIFWAIQKAGIVERVTIPRRIAIAIFVGLVSFVIYDPFLYCYHHVINPGWFDSVVRLREIELEREHTDPIVIAEQLKSMKNSGVAQAGLFRLSAFIPSVVVIPTLIALLSVVLIRRRS
jgi:hypothetical protein